MRRKTTCCPLAFDELVEWFENMCSLFKFYFAHVCYCIFVMLRYFYQSKSKLRLKVLSQLSARICVKKYAKTFSVSDFQIWALRSETDSRLTFDWNHSGAEDSFLIKQLATVPAWPAQYDWEPEIFVSISISISISIRTWETSWKWSIFMRFSFWRELRGAP